MKKQIASLLCICLLCTLLFGCATTDTPGESTAESTAPTVEPVLLVGYGRADITPKESVPLAGLGTATERMSQDVLDPLFATCIAFTDETGNTVLLFHLDLLYAFDAKESMALPYCASEIAKATGVPMKQIMFTSTHNHSAPDLRTNIPVIEAYNKGLRTLLADAAVAAMEDRKPAKMYTSTAYPEGFNYIRHYYMSDGSVAGDNFGDFKNNTIVSHVRESDNQMQLIKFTREGGKDVVLVNWQAHPTGHSSNRYSILSDVHAMRQVMETELDCHFAYFLGASGNVNSRSRIAEEKNDLTYVELYQQLGRCAVDAAADFVEVKTGKVQIIGQEYAGTRKDGTGTQMLSMYAFSLGDVAFITAPYEMFCESGLQIKSGSPFATTFIASCANGNRSYMPSKECFEYGGQYEIGGCQYTPGTAETLVAEYVSMLNTLHPTRYSQG